MDQRLLGAGLGLLGVFALPGPAGIVALGWLGARPSFVVLLLLAIVAFCTITGGALLIWKMLAKQWPPREVIGVLAVVVAARIILDVVRMMGLWLI